MLETFQKGGPIMWPLLLTSVIAVTVVLERLLFILSLFKDRDKNAVQKVFTKVEKGEFDAAIEMVEGTSDFVARALAYGIRHRAESLTNALLRAANLELQRFNRGLSVLDTTITLAPLLGLLGTVTGMIRAFGLLGANELSAPTAITGGIAEALIATAFGLGIAITALIPFNYLNSKLEDARHELEDATSHLELLFERQGKQATS